MPVGASGPLRIIYRPYEASSRRRRQKVGGPLLRVWSSITRILFPRCSLFPCSSAPPTFPFPPISRLYSLVSLRCSNVSIIGR
jgi:hypothetical protein